MDKTKQSEGGGFTCIVEGCERPSRSKRKPGIKHRYGITLEQYEAMVAERGNCCDVCG